MLFESHRFCIRKVNSFPNSHGFLVGFPELCGCTMGTLLAKVELVGMCCCLVLSRLLTSFKLRRLEPGHFAYAMLLGGIRAPQKWWFGTVHLTSRVLRCVVRGSNVLSGFSSHCTMS